MNKRRIQVAVVLGILAIIAIISFQFIWLNEALSQEKRKFNQSVQIALLEVVKLVVNDNQSPFPHTNPVQKISEDYYLVRINDEIDAKILEFYLKNEFEKLNVKSDFEYAIYNCSDDEMVYGNYVSLNHSSPKKTKAFFPKMDGLVYYFAVRFHNQSTFLSGQTGVWTLIAIISLVVLAIYIYSIFVILRQNRYYELQKDFINNMTHEFKTPLSSIILASHYMKDSPLIKEDERLAKYSNALFEQSQRLNEQVERILTLSKSEKTFIKPEFSIVHLNQLITDLAGQIGYQLSEEKNIILDLTPDDIRIKADESHVINLINNLIENAIKYSHPEVKITLRTELKNHHAHLKIRDNGPGIPKKHLGKIFDKFYRVPQEKGRVIKGFGLGLYYVKNICALHGWKMEVDSQLGNGTTFSITMPAIYE